MKSLTTLIIYTFYLLLIALLGTAIQKKEYKCCVPEEWEGKLYLDAGGIFSFSNYMLLYDNGTVEIAYSVPLKKMYIDVRGWAWSTMLRQWTAYHEMQLYDYDKGVYYEVLDGDCKKSELEKNMTEQCIPANAPLLTTGFLGDDAKLPTATYQYTNSASFNVTVTVYEAGTPGICEPVHVIYTMPVTEYGGIVYNLNVMDIGPIKSTDIFNVPKPCNDSR